jgi:hypothetical protein
MTPVEHPSSGANVPSPAFQAIVPLCSAVDDDGVVSPDGILGFVNLVAFVHHTQLVFPNFLEARDVMPVEDRDVLSGLVDILELESTWRWRIDEIETGRCSEDIDEFAIKKACLVELPYDCGKHRVRCYITFVWIALKNIVLIQ